MFLFCCKIKTGVDQLPAHFVFMHHRPAATGYTVPLFQLMPDKETK
jgi:hypothetical protein